MAENMNRKTQVERILQAASTCFADKGNLSNASGVSQDDIKSLFKSKSMIIFELQTSELEKAKVDYLMHMPQATCEETIKFILMSRLDFVEKNLERTQLFFSNGLVGKQPWSSMLDKMIWQLSVELVALVERSMREGCIKKDTNANIAVRSIISFYLTGLVTMGLRGQGFNAKEVWEFIEPQIDFLYDSLKVK